MCAAAGTSTWHSTMLMMMNSFYSCCLFTFFITHKMAWAMGKWRMNAQINTSNLLRFSFSLSLCECFNFLRYPGGKLKNDFETICIRHCASDGYEHILQHLIFVCPLPIWITIIQLCVCIVRILTGDPLVNEVSVKQECWYIFMRHNSDEWESE